MEDTSMRERVRHELSHCMRQPIPDPRSPIPAQTSGQAMVEMALVIGILLLVILGGLDGLQIMMTQYTVSQAVRASAHQAALIGGPDGQNGTWGDGTRPSGRSEERRVGKECRSRGSPDH